MNDLLEKLNQPEYIHVLINHLPITGLFVAVVFLVISLFVKNKQMQVSALALIAALSLSAWFVIDFGQQGYDRVYSQLYEEGQLWLKHHMLMAEKWAFLFYLTSASALMGVVVAFKKEKFFKLVSWITLVLSMITLGVGGYIAEVGGQARHREFRVGDPPADHGSDDHDHPH